LTTRLTLLRHGEAAAGWGEDRDPGLSPLGSRQARAVAAELAGGPELPVVVSPLLRTRETAAPLVDRWGSRPLVEPAVGEIPADAEDPAARSAWLQRVLAGRWTDLDETRRHWRDDALACLRTIGEDSVVVTHFVLINVAIGAATGADEVVCARPDHCSQTVIEVESGRFRLVLGPGEADTVVR
jgi:broad specificity phosphatase PhoE